MEWISALAVFAIVAGVTIAVIVLLSLSQFRQNVDESATRQAQQVKRLAEAIAVLNQQQQAAQAKIQILTDANRKLADEVAVLNERIGDGDEFARVAGAPRLLH